MKRLARRLGASVAVTTVTMAVLVLSPQSAFADRVGIDVSASSPTFEATFDDSASQPDGSSAPITVAYTLTTADGDGTTGCNASPGNQVTVYVVAGTGTEAVVSPFVTELTFTSCGVPQPISYTMNNAGVADRTAPVVANLHVTNVLENGAQTPASRYPVDVAQTLTWTYAGPSDTTRPVVSVTADRAPDQHLRDGTDWYTGDVTWTPQGADGGSGVDHCDPAVRYTGPDRANASLTFNCWDHAGNKGSASVTFNFDTVAPLFSRVAFTAIDAYVPGTWTSSDYVFVGFNTSDRGSGMWAEEMPGTVVYRNEGVNVDPERTLCDRVGNCTTIPAAAVNIDRTAPELYPSVAPTTVRVGDSATASPNATDSLSGVASQSCGPIDTSSAGTRTVTCTATDNAGLTAATTVQVVVEPAVQYPSGGTYAGEPVKQALQPIDPDGSSVFKHKSTVPLRFRLIDASGNLVTDPSVITGLYKVFDSSLQPNAVVDEPVDLSSPSSVFRYDPETQQFAYNLSTKYLKPATQYTYRVKLNDGSYFDFTFGLK